MIQRRNLPKPKVYRVLTRGGYPGWESSWVAECAFHFGPGVGKMHFRTWGEALAFALEHVDERQHHLEACS